MIFAIVFCCLGQYFLHSLLTFILFLKLCFCLLLFVGLLQYCQKLGVQTMFWVYFSVLFAPFLT